MQDPYLHIEDYVEGTLSEVDRAAFETAMSTDEKLKAAVEDFGLLGIIGEALIEEEIAGIVAEELEVSGADTKVSGSWGVRLLALLVGLGLLAGLAWWVFAESPQETKHKELMALYIYPENRGTRSLHHASTKLDSAIYLFDLRQFDNSKNLFLQILESDSLNQDANFYMAHISFVKEDYLQVKKYCFNDLDIEDNLACQLIKLRG